jgi:Dolichyl-phosphate-mannose-protein mannosyltransferase
MVGRTLTSIMTTQTTQPVSTQPINKEQMLGTWFETHADLAAAFVVVTGFLARLWTASGTFLNPDEALHFRLANQMSLALAYKQALTAAHPPGLIILLYFWRDLGTSELWLRMPSVIAGSVFCWAFYKWLAAVTDRLTGFIGLLFVSLLAPIVGISAEIRQYALLLAFLGCALYFLDRAFAEKSPSLMAMFSFFLYLAMLSHYSAFLFAAALGVDALCRIFAERPPFKVVSVWAIGQLLGLSLGALLYKIHLSHLGVGDSRTVLQGFMSEFYLRRSYYDPAHDNPALFLVGHSFGVFQFFFGQLALGDAVGLLFLVGVASLLWSGRWSGRRPDDARSTRWLAALLLLPFAIAWVASLRHVYPYGGTRHVAFLIIPGVAGVSVALGRLAAGRWARGIAFALLILALCLIFGKPRPPRMDRANQNRVQMASAMEFVRQNIPPSSVIFVDYQTDLMLGNYLCRQQPIVLDAPVPGFESFSCGGYRVISADYKTAWMFSSENFVSEWKWLVRAYGLQPGEKVWNFQCGWGIKLAGELRSQFAEFRDLPVTSFGENIQIFPLTVGQPIPAADAPAQRSGTGIMVSPSARTVNSGTDRGASREWAALEFFFSWPRK